MPQTRQRRQGLRLVHTNQPHATATPSSPIQMLASNTTSHAGKKKATYSRTAQKQIKKTYEYFNRLNQFPFSIDTNAAQKLFPRDKKGNVIRDENGKIVRKITPEQAEKLELLKKWKYKGSTNEARKDIQKIVRVKKNSENKNQVQRIKMTTEGKYLMTMFAPAAREWRQMDARQQERYSQFLIEKVAEYWQMVSRRKGHKTRTLSSVRETILPELQRAREMLANTITGERKENMDVYTKEGLQRKLSIFDGVIAKLEHQKREKEMEPFRREVREKMEAGERSIREVGERVERRRQLLKSIEGEIERQRVLSRSAPKKRGVISIDAVREEAARRQAELEREIAERAWRPPIPAKKTMGERTRERWTRIREGVKRIRERMRGKKREE